MQTGTGCFNHSPSVATIGFFDGVHRGHRCLIGQVCREAARRGLPPAVVTFRRHPREVVQPGFHPQLLTTCEEKLALLAETGIERCLPLDFTPQLALLPARAFMQLLKEQYRVAALVIGYDHRFGHNRKEGLDDYMRYGKELGMEVIPAQAYHDGEEGAGEPPISSSLIRNQLHKGEVETAARFLGYNYFLEGAVTEGHRIGHELGFPTANLQVNCPDKVIPADGVYAVRVHVDGNAYEGMLCIGTRPTLRNGTDRTIETHIFDFDRDIYHHPMRLSFVCRTRTEQHFATTGQLIEQLRKDEAQIRRLLAEGD